MTVQAERWSIRAIAYAAVGVLFALVVVVTNQAVRAWAPLAVVVGAGLGWYAYRLTTLSPARGRAILRRTAAGVAFGTVLGLAQVAALAGSSGAVPFDAALGLAICFVAFAAAFGAMSGESAPEPEAGDVPSGRAEEVRRFGLRGFARRAAGRLADAHRTPEDEGRV